MLLIHIFFLHYGSKLDKPFLHKTSQSLGIAREVVGGLFDLSLDVVHSFRDSIAHTRETWGWKVQSGIMGASDLFCAYYMREIVDP